MKNLVTLVVIAAFVSACGYRNSIYNLGSQQYAYVTGADSKSIYQKQPDGSWRIVYNESGGVPSNIPDYDPKLPDRLLKDGVLVGTISEDDLIKSRSEPERPRPTRLAPGDGVRVANPVTPLIVDGGGD